MGVSDFPGFQEFPERQFVMGASDFFEGGRTVAGRSQGTAFAFPAQVPARFVVNNQVRHNLFFIPSSFAASCCVLGQPSTPIANVEYSPQAYRFSQAKNALHCR
jgi:hypothetical protein